MKRAMAIILLILLILSFAGCKEKDPTESPPQKFGATLTGEGGSGLYTRKEIILQNSNDYVRRAAEGSDGIYLYCMTTGDTPKGYFAKLNPETGEIESTDYSTSDSVFQIFASYDGKINTLETRPVEGSGDLTFFVREIGADGSVANELNLDFLKEYENSPIMGIVSTEQGLLISLINSVVLVNDGKIVNSFEFRGKPKKIVQSADDSYLICGIEDSGYVVAELSSDLRSTTKYTMDGEYTTPFDGMGSAGVYLADSSNLYSVDYKTGARETMINFVANGVSALSNIIMLPGGGFFALEGMGVASIWLPSSVSAGDIVTLKLATFNSSSALTETVLGFNKQSEKYKVDLVDYSTYNTGDVLMGGLTKLNTEIIAGNYPDIYDLSVLSADTYSSKGALEDLRPFIDNDADFEYGDFLGSAMETLSDDGKLYQFVPGFSVSFMVGDASVIGDKDTWTPEQFLSLANNNKDKSVLSAHTSQEDFISYILSFSGEDFISKKNKTCSFDSATFSSLIVYAGTLPPRSEVSAEIYETNYQILSGNQLLDFRDTGLPISDLVVYDKLFDQAKTVGFPTSEGTGYAMTPYLNFGMSSSSENKEGIWEFFRFMLSKSYQGKMSDSYKVLPVLSGELEKSIDNNVLNGPKGIPIYDPNGGKTTILECDPPDSSTADRAWEIINQIDRVNKLDETVYSIVMDEAAAYFQGQKSLNEVTALIQSRLQLYVSEQG